LDQGEEARQTLVLDSSAFSILSFAECQSLSSICTPNYLEILCLDCFLGCQYLRQATFEAPSHLRRLECAVFCHCSLLVGICVPNSVEDVCSESFELVRLSCCSHV
jgi:hypothetical protein